MGRDTRDRLGTREEQWGRLILGRGRFYQQAHLAAKEGRNPLVDLGDQISYLRGKFDVDVPIEELPENLQTTALPAQNFQLHQQELIDLLSDPTFYKSAAIMGDDTYAPVNFRLTSTCCKARSATRCGRTGSSTGNG